MAEYIVNLDCSEPIEVGDVNRVTIVHNKIERIVRCRDCKYATPMEPDGFRLDCHGYLTTSWDYENDVPQENVVHPDGFCSWGKQKD